MWSEKGENASAFWEDHVEVLGDCSKRRGPVPLHGSDKPGPGGPEGLGTALPSPAAGFHGGCQRTKYTLVNDSH